jgi:hypothetical protein
MRHSVKRTFVFLGVRKYTHIRLQKRFKFKKHKFFQERRGSPQPCNFKRTQGLPVLVSHHESFVSPAPIHENRDYEPPVCRVE